MTTEIHSRPEEFIDITWIRDGKIFEGSSTAKDTISAKLYIALLIKLSIKFFGLKM